MKLFSFVVSLMFATQAYALAPNDFFAQISWDDQADSFLQFVPDPGTNAILAWDPTSTSGRIGVGGTGGMTYWTLGSGLGYSSGILSVVGKQNTITAGTSSQFLKGDFTLGTVITDLSGFTNGPGFVTTSGNVATATKLLTSRTIGGVSFDGTSNISLTSGSAVEKGNGSGGFTSANAGIDYQAPISLTTTGSGAATLVSNTLNIPTPVVTSRVFNQTTPTINASGTQISASRDALVSCTVDVTVSSLLLGTAAGSASLRYADNSGMTTNLVSVISGQSAVSGVLSLVNTSTITLSGVIPAGEYRQIIGTTTSGTATFSNTKCQEVLM